MVKQYIGEKLNNMSCENMIEMMEIMQEQVQKKKQKSGQKLAFHHKNILEKEEDSSSFEVTETIEYKTEL